MVQTRSALGAGDVVPWMLEVAPEARTKKRREEARATGGRNWLRNRLGIEYLLATARLVEVAFHVAVSVARVRVPLQQKEKEGARP